MTRKFNPKSIGELRDSQRAELARFDSSSVYLPNPTASAPIDKMEPLSYEQKVQALGLQPNLKSNRWIQATGDAGAGSSVYRVAEILQNLADDGDRASATPYSKAIALATCRSADNRPKYFQANLFSVGRLFYEATQGPLPTSEITRFASGIPAGTPSISGRVQFGVPQFSTTQFRIMVSDESGQRFVDADVCGTRTFNLYGFGVTVFALIKEDGYEIDRQSDNNPVLGPGLLDQSVIGSRVIPISANATASPANRTVTMTTNSGDRVSVPIPTGARRVQGYVNIPNPEADAITVNFSMEDPLNIPPIGVGVFGGRQGKIDFSDGALNRTSIYDVPNANCIVIEHPGVGGFRREWVFVFEVIP